MSRLFKASVIENLELINNYFRITLHPLEKIQKPKPGNFFMLSVDTRLDPLLKRPFSVHNWMGGNFQLLYRVVGKGTNILSKKRPGDVLELIGPLGNSFPIIKNKNIILVAGGLGIAPLFALAQSVSKRNPLLFYGTRTRKEVLCNNELRSININPVISTDDGSLGKKGFVTHVLRNFLSQKSSPVSRYVLYACGPEPMLKSLSVITKRHKLKGYIALEQNMACGLGTCLGCVVKTIHGFKRVCKEGPVFPAEEVVWNG